MFVYARIFVLFYIFIDKPFLKQYDILQKVKLILKEMETSVDMMTMDSRVCSPP